MRKIRRGDEVIVISGRNKGQRGRVRVAIPDKDRVIIEGVNIVKRHRARGRARQAGIIEMEAPLHVSNVMYWSPRANKGVRVHVKLDENGKNVRYYVHEEKDKDGKVTKREDIVIEVVADQR
jgi:large subunit ribosomal protein L24